MGNTWLSILTTCFFNTNEKHLEIGVFPGGQFVYQIVCDLTLLFQKRTGGEELDDVFL